MNDLTEMLQRSAADVPVGPPPLAAMHRTARRRRSGAVGLAAAAAVVVATGSVALWPSGDVADTREPAPAASDSPNPAPQPDPADDVPPAGTRWVGIGRAVIAIPDSWGTNATGCGTPRRDTVVVDEGVIELCLSPFPSDTTSVTIRERNAVDEIDGWPAVEIDGEAALRSPISSGRGFGGSLLHGASVYFPERDVMFAAESSVSAEAASEVLDGITILDTLVAVPGFSPANYDGEQRKAGENYVRTLMEAGLRAEVVVEASGSTPGFILGTSPRPGTVVEPGSVVRVTVTG